MFNHTTRRRAALVALLIGVSVPTTVAAQATDHDGPTTPTVDAKTAKKNDIKIIAADNGWSIKDTYRHMNHQDKFGDLVDRVIELAPQQFAGSEYAESPGATSYIHFKGNAPSNAKQVIESSRLNADFTEGRQFSQTQLESRSVRVAKLLAKRGAQQVSTMVEADGTIAVTVTGDEALNTSLPSGLAVGVTVHKTTDDVAVDFHTYGGAEIHGATAECTTGFSVVNLSSGVSGVTTAAHCTGMNHYHQPESLTTYDVDFENQHVGLFGDVEWHSTLTPSHTDFAEYYARPTERRDVNSVEGTISVNGTYCVFSRQQGTRSCDQVRSTFATAFTSAGLASNLVSMDDSNAVAGDSGGPWSFANEAAGTAKGINTSWNLFSGTSEHDTWSKASLFPAAIGVAVLT